MSSDRTGTFAHYQMDRVAGKGKGGRRGGVQPTYDDEDLATQDTGVASERATFQRDPGHAKKKCKEGENHDILTARCNLSEIVALRFSVALHLMVP